MNSHARRAAVIVLVAVAFAAFPLIVLANHSWGGYHWARTSNPLNLQVGNNMTTADWSSHFTTAISDWNKSTVLNLLTVAGTSNKHCGMVAGTVQVCNGNYGNNGWLGLATINLTGGTHITQGSAKMNDTYFNTSTYNNPNERQHVVCQEIGHTFGLDHQDTSGADLNTCMDYFSNTGAHATSTDSTHPNAGDYDELLCIYDPADAGKTLSSPPHSCTGTGHLDSTNTAAAKTASSAAQAAGVDGDDPDNWGQLVSQSANGRSSTYERNNADGSKTVTFVTWTIEAAQNCPGCDHRYDH